MRAKHQTPRTKHKVSIFAFSVLSVFGGFAFLTAYGITGMLKLKKVKVVEEEYKILVKGKPLDITAEGPVNLRISTHILFPETKAEEKYSVVLESEEGEKFYSFNVPSSRIRDEKGRSYGRERVINVSVPSGTHHYRLHLFSATKETCAVKLILEKTRWEEVKPMVCKGEVSLKKDGGVLYYETPVLVSLKGGSYKILARLLYPDSSRGEKREEDTLTIFMKREEGKEEWVKKFIVSLSPKETAKKERVSYVKATYLELEAGNYRIETGKRGMVKVYEKKNR